MLFFVRRLIVLRQNAENFLAFHRNVRLVAKLVDLSRGRGACL